MLTVECKRWEVIAWMEACKQNQRKSHGKKTVQICKRWLWSPYTSSVNQDLNNHGWIEVKETLSMCHTNVVVKKQTFMAAIPKKIKNAHVNSISLIILWLSSHKVHGEHPWFKINTWLSLTDPIAIYIVQYLVLYWSLLISKVQRTCGSTTEFIIVNSAF